MASPEPRTARVTRKTKETEVRVELCLDGEGRAAISTGLGMLDHLLEQLARHGLFDLTVEAKGDLQVGDHHLVEDVAIALGKAFLEALGDYSGISRMGDALVPMDEALAQVAVDLGGRGYAALELRFDRPRIGDLSTEMIGHFLSTLAREMRANLHVRLLSGVNDHHRAEAAFKALARALDGASRRDERRAGQLPSTKERIGP